VNSRALYGATTATGWPWVAAFSTATQTRTGIDLLPSERDADEELPLLASAATVPISKEGPA
jgi:hypothetical protein